VGDVDTEHPPEKLGPTHRLPCSNPVATNARSWQGAHTQGRVLGPLTQHLRILAKGRIDVPCTTPHAYYIDTVVDWHLEDDVPPEREVAQIGCQLFPGSTR
jgi:hypothetical protein